MSTLYRKYRPQIFADVIGQNHVKIILQHEIDHLNGTLYIDRAQLPTLMTAENYIKLYKDKGVKEIQADLSSNINHPETAH